MGSYEQVHQKYDSTTPAGDLSRLVLLPQCFCLWSTEGTAVGEISVRAGRLVEGQHPHRLQITEEATLPAEPDQLWCAVDCNPIIKGIACSTDQACLCWHCL